MSIIEFELKGLRNDGVCKKMSLLSHFEPVYGKPCWQVEQGWGSNLTLEFGNPKLQVSKVAVRPTDANSREQWQKRPPRDVHVRGDWRLWIHCCHWKLTLGFGRPLKVHSESSREDIASALRILNGQELTKVTINPSKGSSKFEFDLGATLSTLRYEHLNIEGEPYQSWLLKEPSGHWLTYVADGELRYSGV